MEQYNSLFSKTLRKISSTALMRLDVPLPWPENVRQLKLVIAKTVQCLTGLSLRAEGLLRCQRRYLVLTEFNYLKILDF